MYLCSPDDVCVLCWDPLHVEVIVFIVFTNVGDKTAAMNIFHLAGVRRVWLDTCIVSLTSQIASRVELNILHSPALN